VNKDFRTLHAFDSLFAARASGPNPNFCTLHRQASRFAAVRVTIAHRHAEGAGPGPDVWLLSEWPRDERAPTKYYLSSLPATTSLRTLVRFGKLRWRIERDYQELKGELGLDHFEGRTWNGVHHHVALCAAAHAFLALRRALFPPAVDSVDPRRRAPTPSTAFAPASAAVSAMPAAHGQHASTARPIANVIK
jgi:SRSO17 transposase